MRAHDGPTITNDHHRFKVQPDQDLVAAATTLAEAVIGQKYLTRSRRHHHRCCNWSTYCWLLTIILGGWLVPTEAGPRYSSRIVETKSGAIRGVILELNSKYLEPVEVFKAVPYATPPVGNLRLEPPKKLPPWKGTKLADTFGRVCPQSFPDINNRTAALLFMPKGRYQHLKRLIPLLANQSEDCLTLNIYVPGSGSRGLEAPYSIFFYIHGEAYDWGSGNPYDGSILASYGHVIVITVNFRLGILGFLKTRASTSPGSGGNLGLMDIILALQWVRDNIAAFGGDPKRVTLAGHDTGAALANMILISKAGKGLIHRAILLSGSALSPWALIPEPDAIRLEVSQQMACHLLVDPPPGKPALKPSTDDITDCLRDKPLEALMGVRLTNVRFMPSWGPFLPLENSLDPEFAMEHSGEGFITSELMLGMTTTESYNDFSAADIQYGLEEEQRNRLLRTFIRNAFTFHLNEIFSAVRNEYTDWDKPIQHPINIRDSTMEALSDGHTVAPLIKVAYLHARRGAKTYMFHFGYQSKESEYPQRLGSVRGEDLPYILGLPLVQGVPSFPQNYSRQDMGVNEAVLNFVSNFCKTGDPNDAGHQTPLLHPDYGTAKERTRFRGITWDTFETATQQYLSISTKPKMRSHYRGHKMALWLNLIPQLHRPGDPEVSMRHHHFRERDPHYYAGSVRAESFSRPRMYGNGIINDAQESRLESFGTECTPDPTMGEVLQEGNTDGGLLSEEEEEELLEKLANRHYYSYTAALGVTVGVGCLLLLLNMLIFAGIYYQRDRSRRRKSQTSSGSGSGSGSRNNGSPSPDEADIPLTTIPSPSPTKAKRSHEPPPSYATLPKRNSGNNHQHHLLQQQQQSPQGVELTKDPNPTTASLGRSGSLSYKQQNTLPETFSLQQQTALTMNESVSQHHQPSTDAADTNHHYHIQTLPRAAKSAPLPPIRSSSNSACSSSPNAGSVLVVPISGSPCSSASPPPSTESILHSAVATQTGTPLTSILVNSSNHHHHHHHQHRQPQPHMAGVVGNSNIITVDLVNSTNPKHSNSGGSSYGPRSNHFIGSTSLGNNSSNTHHHHHHLHHHASSSGGVGDGGGGNCGVGTVGSGSVGLGGSGNLTGSMANQNQPSTSGMNPVPGAGSASTLKKRVQIQEITV
ncbi:neuroligin-4, X-linked-like [Malaya genurostris]|uniref:neuroligin-4, X-linked-like n=1 Tax=Malaya genurostris TaxID=325434 RepID=UPI0026F3CF2F|nr:neuroligin-4, X-linked-like [Malaya genurostris]